MKNFSQFLAVMLLACTQVFGQNIQTFIADYDALLSLSVNTDPTAANTNFSSIDRNAAYHLMGQFQSHTYTNRSLIHFDFSSIPPGTFIESATMDLFSYAGAGGSLAHQPLYLSESTLRRVDAPWDVNTVTWNNQPPASSTFFPAILPPPMTEDQNYLGIDVTNIVRDMIDNPSQNHGFQLRIFDEQLLGGALTFCSRDHADPNKWPRIHIKFCQSPTTIFAKYDAAIGTNPSLGTSNNNYGTAAQNAAYCMTSDDNTASGHLNRALFKFDFNNIASTAVIYSAKLSLSALGASGNLSGHTGTANQSELLRVPTTWDESTVTWDNQPAFGNLVAVLPQSTNPLQDYTNIDVTNAVRDMIANQNDNHGFLLKLQTEVELNALLFHSLNSGVAGKGPKLTIDLDCSSIVSATESLQPEISLYPNPASNSLKFSLQIPEAANATIQLFDLQGRELRSYHAYLGSSGSHTLDISTLITDQPAGIYIVRAKFGEQVVDRKLVLTGN